MDTVIDWLLNGPAFVRYRTLLDLCNANPDDTDVESAYREMIDDPKVKALVETVNAWEEQRPITRHNDSVHPLHQLVFAASIGIRAEELSAGITSILSHQSEEGPFQVRIVIPKAFGGDDAPKWDWVATDAPLVLYALLRLGLRTPDVIAGVDALVSHREDPGFPCFASSSMGRFKGPGKRGDPCPYANLIMLRMLAQLPDRIESPEAVGAVKMLFDHWTLRKQKKYFLFGIGTDFAKPKAPRIWYDVVHYLDTLSRFPAARADSRLAEVAALLQDQMDSNGQVTPRSAWMKWKGWEFCQKREPSRWLTFLTHRALNRLAAAG